MLTTEISAFVASAGDASYEPSLAGKRILITGVTGHAGAEIARQFVDAGARVMLQCDEASPVTQAIAEQLAPLASQLSVHATPLDGTEAVLGFARAATAEFGGFDMVVNVVALDGRAPPAGASEGEVEARVSDLLLKPCLIARVAANRMRLMMIDGSILTVAVLGADTNRDERAFAQVVRATLTGMTRAEAEAWATEGIRFNAVAPDVLGLVAPVRSGRESDVAELAVYLAAGNSPALSGMTFDQGLVQSI